MEISSSSSPKSEFEFQSQSRLARELREILAGGQLTWELPYVALVGSHGSGKSSVIQSLVGKNFLPVGNNVGTRRPLILHFHRTTKWDRDVEEEEEEEEEWGEFLHLPGERFYNFSDIRREIQMSWGETDKEAGEDKDVSDKEIWLKIFSPNVDDMTVVDLPGITEVPVGDQPCDIVPRIKSIVMSYIKRPTCLILAVTPASSDLANSDALRLARIIDRKLIKGRF